MNDIIRLLPDSVANQIAAGEVIQRPASVIKELVENSIDAGANDVKIILKDAGRTLIQVVDNGCGMSETDARMAFERHATSKISKAQDLYSLHTMGFRGEALASIAAVAQIELRTMRREDTIGTRLIINGSHVESQEPAATTPGTNLMVKNLFYTVPARRKFLKKDNVELSALIREFERLALVNPTVSFTMWHNDQILYQLSPSPMKKRICDLFGKNLDKQLIPVSTDTSIVRLDGFIGLPANARKRNALQYFLINGRNMRHPLFHKAVMACYEELLPADSQPNYFISFTVEPDTIDVNIHPTKNEIKFENEFGIQQILIAAIKESLGRFNAMPGIDFNVDDAPDIPVFNPNENAGHGVDIDLSYNPFDSKPSLSDLESEVSKGMSRPASSKGQERPLVNDKINSTDWEKLYEEFERTRTLELEQLTCSGESAMNRPPTQAAPPRHQTEQPSLDICESPQMAGLLNVMQISSTYLATPCRSGLMIIDQHRAHIRVLYEQLIEQLKRNEPSTQAVLFPEIAQLDTNESVFLESIAAEVAKLGFDISPLGDNSWSISGVPSQLGKSNPAEVLRSLIHQAEETESQGEIDSLSTRTALGMAKALAIKSNTRLSEHEMQQLLGDLLKLPTPNYTPDGLKIINIIESEEIHNRLAR